MSGGVDSSVAAALLVEQGYDVVGVMMRLWSEDENRCCTPQAVDDARHVAAQLGIPFYLVNYEAEFQACVVDHFVAEYSRGRTPNPCLACNRHIRFGHLLRHAQALGASFLARLQAELDAGVSVQPHPDIGAGFQIGGRGEAMRFDFTDVALAESLAAYLNPRFAWALDELRPGQEGA